MLTGRQTQTTFIRNSTPISTKLAIQALKELLKDTQRNLREHASGGRKSISALATLFVSILLLVALAPTVYAASPFERAVLFLDTVGAHLTPAGHLATLTRKGGLPQKEEEKTVLARTAPLSKEKEQTAPTKQEETIDEAAKTARPEPARYVVRKGDTLSAIAQSFGISMRTITVANNLRSSSALQIGQELIILPVDGVEHTVAGGETLSYIAKKYDADIDEIITFNNIQDSSHIRPGERIIVPGAAIQTSTTALAVQKKQSPIPAVPVASAAPAKAPTDVSGNFIFPVTGNITQGLHFLNAVDMGGSAYCGTPVKAAAAGTVKTVTHSGWHGGYGNYIKISHAGGVETIYAHNAQNIVAPGQSVVQGETIAYMGSTGNSTGCHVHFAVRGADNPFK